MICDLMTSLSIDMRTFMVREIKMEWDSLFCVFYEDFNVQILVLKIILIYYFHIFVLLKKKSDLRKT